MNRFSLFLIVISMAAYGQPVSLPQPQPHRVCVAMPVVEASGQTTPSLPQQVRSGLVAFLSSGSVRLLEADPECDFQLTTKVVRTGGEGSKGFGGLPSIDKAAGDLATISASTLGKASPTIARASTIAVAAGKWLKRPKPFEIKASVKLTAKDGRNLLDDEPISAKSTSDDNLIATVLQTVAARVLAVLAMQPK